MPSNYHDELVIKLTEQTNQIVSFLPDFSRKFFNNLKDKNMSTRTRLQYAYDMHYFFTWLSRQSAFQSFLAYKGKNTFEIVKQPLPSDILDKLTVEDLQEYANTLDTYTGNDGNQHLYAVETKARRLSSLRSFYRYFFKIGAVHSNIAELIDIPHVPDKEIITMDHKQVQRLLNAVSDEAGMNSAQIKRHQKLVKRDFAIVMTFLGTGIRVSELAGINVSDVDLFNASLLITRKGGDQDLAYFGAEVQTAIEDYLQNSRNSFLKNKSENALFLSNRGTRITVRNIEFMIEKYAQKAGINTKITPHALRRTYGTNLYNETGDIYLVADALHHSSVETTKKHYAKMSEDHKRKAAKASSSLFEKE